MEELSAFSGCEIKRYNRFLHWQGHGWEDMTLRQNPDNFINTLRLRISPLNIFRNNYKKDKYG
jgi:hypothetical protein